MEHEFKTVESVSTVAETSIINSDGTAYDGRKVPLLVALGFTLFLIIGGISALVV